jgi:hypothetical protein
MSDVDLVSENSWKGKVAFVLSILVPIFAGLAFVFIYFAPVALLCFVACCIFCLLDTSNNWTWWAFIILAIEFFAVVTSPFWLLHSF